MTWQEWATALLGGIKAPDTPTNHATLTGWMTHEKGDPANWAQFCNPLNTTEPWPGARDSGAQPGLHDVKIYATLGNGLSATLTTLVWEPNGTGTAYAGIVAALRGSLPTQWWKGAARSQLDTWGTGQSWLDSVPLTEDLLADLDRMQTLLEGIAGRFWAVSGSTPTVQNQLNAIQKAVTTATPGTTDLSPVLAAIADLKAHPAVVADPAALAAIQKVDAHFSGH